MAAERGGSRIKIISYETIRDQVRKWSLHRFGSAEEQEKLRTHLLERRLQCALCTVGADLRTRDKLPKSWWTAWKLLKAMMVRTSYFASRCTQ